MKKLKASTPADALGVKTPVKSKRGQVRVTAWRDTDEERPRGPATFFLDVQMTGWPSHELLGVSAARIKALGEAFLDLHKQLTEATPAAK